MKMILLVSTLALLVNSTGRTEEINPLSATIAVHKTSLILGEPLFVDLTLKNNGKGDRALAYSPDVGCAFLSSDGKTFKSWSDNMRLRGYMEPYILKPGQIVKTPLCVLYGYEYGTKTGKYAFPESDEYFIQGGYTENGRDVVRSESVSIKVALPHGEDAEVWAKLQGMESYGRIVQIPTQKGEDAAVAELAKIVDDHPTSLYSHYLALALGKNAHYARHPSATPFALKYYEIASNMTRVPTLREEAMSEWSELLNRRNQKEKAAQVLERLLLEFPDTRGKPHIEQWLKKARPVKQ